VSGPLFESLERLDVLLKRAVVAAAKVQQASHPHRGVQITAEDIADDLARPAGIPRLAIVGDDGEAAPRRLIERFGLSSFEADVVILAFAMDIDLRYERVYSLLNDHAGRPWPTVDLCLTLLCRDRDERLARLHDFGEGGTLRRFAIVRVGSEEPFLARSIRLDPIVAAFLLGAPSLEGDITRVTMRVPEPAPGLAVAHVEPRDRAVLARFVQGGPDGAALPLVGVPASGKELAAQALAAELGQELVVARADRLRDARQAQRMRLYAALSDSVLYVEDPSDDEIAVLAPPSPGRVVLGLSTERHDLPGPAVRLEPPNLAARRTRWQQGFERAGICVPAGALDRVAARFELGVAQIDRAISKLERGASGAPTARDMLTAAREQCGAAPALAEEIVPQRGWRDLVLPEHSMAQLRALCARIEHRERVLHDWGFGAKLVSGLGTNALFAGPSGTGKTLAAEIVAGELGVPLFRVNLANLVSKYIGETEKNLQTVFAAAEQAHATLFFDEADSLFGKRSTVRDSHDRYANLEISYLLQRMESYRGLSILATNMRQNLDEAFVRRLAFTVQFPFPGATEREQIWRRVWPEAAPLHHEIDFSRLAQCHKLSGGSIRNAALAAAFLAPDEGGIQAAHIEHAIEREYHKLGLRMADELRATA
jgi:hypothetical protein